MSGLSSTGGGLAVVRLPRYYFEVRDDGDGGALLRPGTLGQTFRLPTAGTVALAGVFQLIDAVLGRRVVTECRCSRSLGADERAVIHRPGGRIPIIPGMGDIPHGLPGALAWAVLGVGWLCGGIIALPLHTTPADDAGRLFPHRIAA